MRLMTGGVPGAGATEGFTAPAGATSMVLMADQGLLMLPEPTGSAAPVADSDTQSFTWKWLPGSLR